MQSAVAAAVRAARLLGVETVSAFTSSNIATIRGLNAFVDESMSPPPPQTVDCDLGPLWGAPIAVKANICVEGRLTTAASAMLATHRPSYTATAVARLSAAGAIIAGTTNMDEFGMGNSTAFSAHGAAYNPYSLCFMNKAALSADTGMWLSPGGSSGGSAIAVATGAVCAALGSDTGGSVRLPAAFCGIVGFKPSYGRISRHGLIAYASSLDTIGVLARSVGDAALLYDVIAGHDAMDDTCVRSPRRNVADIMSIASTADCQEESYARLRCPELTLQGLRIGCPVELRELNAADDVLRAWDCAADALRSAGATVVDVSIPSLLDALPAYYIIAAAEAASNLSRYDGMRFGGAADFSAIPSKNFRETVEILRSTYLGQEVQQRIMIGNLALSQDARHTYYHAALQVRELLARDFRCALGGSSAREASVDLLLSPVAPVLPWRSSDAMMLDPALMYKMDAMTVPASLAGLPAISIPVGLSFAGPGGVAEPVPVSVQLTGRSLGDDAVLCVAAALEALLRVKAPHWMLPTLQPE
jgi:aspartyl-tRNA(Asn)/glutamyl-tRNA(Gln) amidotransferase subunit A